MTSKTLLRSVVPALFAGAIAMIATVGQAAAQDGSKIAFSSGRDGNTEIYVMDADGLHPTNLTNHPAGDSTPASSPDGKFIAFSSFRGGNRDIYVMDADGSNPTRLTYHLKNDVTPAFSPDGTKIAFSSGRDGNTEIYVMDADGSNLTNLTNNAASDVTPAFSPDGTIAFSSFRGGNRDIYVMNADGSNLTRLTDHADDDREPAFSPDGTKIAFNRGETLGNGEIYVMDAADGLNQWNLTNNAANDSQPTYSPDGTKIAFSSGRDGNTEIYVMDADGSNQTNLTNNPATDFQPAWGPLTDTDTDGDGVPDSEDNCPNDFNDQQEDADGDGVGDVCDNCPSDDNPDQLNGDDDSVGDACDNCPKNTNDSQADIDGDGRGTACDPNETSSGMKKATKKKLRKPPSSSLNPFTINSNGEDDNTFYAGTPHYRERDSGYGIIEFSAEPGFGVPRQPDIGHPDADDSRVIKLSPLSASAKFNGVYVALGTLNPNATLQQSSWHSIMTPDLYAAPGEPTVRFHNASHANGKSVGYEIDLEQQCGSQPCIPPGVTDVEITIAQVVELPATLCLDQSELTNSAGNPVPGRLTIKDCTTDKPEVRISPARFAALGKRTVLKDNDAFKATAQLIAELGADVKMSPNYPDDDVGTNYGGPIEFDKLVQTETTFEENQADSANAITTVTPVDGDSSSFVVSMVIPADLIARNLGISKIITIGQTWSSLTPVDFGNSQVRYGRLMVAFDEEAKITGRNVTLELENTLGSPPTFDGLPANYDLFPNGGGSAAHYNSLEQSVTGVRCNGCSWDWDGDNNTIRFNGGGEGVHVSGGGRVGPAHPCLTDARRLDPDTNTGQCAPDKGKRGKFRVKKLLIEGSMAALGGAESDIELEELVFYQAPDPNVTNNIHLQRAGGVSCAADSGRSLTVNPSDGELVANGPVDLSTCDCAGVERSCSRDEVARGDCLPTLPYSPSDTGVCNVKLKTMKLFGMGSPNNPLGTDLTLPTGIGVALAFRAGNGQIGAKSYNPLNDRCDAGPAAKIEVSVIEGFLNGMTIGGGANKDPDTAEGLTEDHPKAVAPNVYCIDRVRIDKAEVGIVVGPNADARASSLDIQDTQFMSVFVANGGANVATVENTSPPCPSIDEDELACLSAAEENACSECKKGGESYLAVSGAGKTAPAKLEMTGSNVCLKEGKPSCGLNLVLGPLNVDPETLVAEKELTIWRKQSSLAGVAVYLTNGADTIVKPKLMKVKMRGNNIGSAKRSQGNNSSACFGIDNREGREAEIGLDAVDNCCLGGDGECHTAEDGTPQLAGLVEDTETLFTDTQVQTDAGDEWNPGGADRAVDHKCYGVPARGAPSVNEVVRLNDGIIDPPVVTDATVNRAISFCNPVNIEGNGIQDLEAHLTCYDIDEETPPLPTVTVKTLLGPSDTVTLGKANRLCVPAIKNEVGELGQLQARLNHFKCYETKEKAPKGTKTEEPLDLEDQLEDQLETTSTVVKNGPFLVCNAVSKHDVPIVEGPGIAQHLACFSIQDAAGKRKSSITTVNAEDQFNSVELDLDKGRWLCVPANVEVVP
jgi:Tol biopolymer transport system component